MVDVLSASGLRAIRYAKEIDNLKVLINILFYFCTTRNIKISLTNYTTFNIKLLINIIFINNIIDCLFK